MDINSTIYIPISRKNVAVFWYLNIPSFILDLTTLCISCYYFECKSNHFAESFAPCKLELEETVSKKRVEFAVNTRKRRNIERGLTDRNYPGSSWKPKGALIAHLHEHKVISKLFVFSTQRAVSIQDIFWGQLIGCSSTRSPCLVRIHLVRSPVQWDFPKKTIKTFFFHPNLMQRVKIIIYFNFAFDA